VAKRPLLRVQVISGDGEVLQYVDPDPGEPTTTVHASAKALVKPAVPPHDVPSKPLLGGSVLMKPTGSLREDAGPEWDADQRAEGDRVGLENVARAEALLG
jgi:hypothetical protein